MKSCPCGHINSYQLCCMPLHKGEIMADNPEQLMRSRYSAYVMQEIDYLLSTTHPRMRYLHARVDIENWATANSWERLEIITTLKNTVEFKAYFRHKNKLHIHHEISDFELENDRWYYVTGSFPE